MSSCYGEALRLSLFGQSHSPAIGVVADGLPAGFPVDQDALQQFMARRAPGQSDLTTSRREADQVEFLSGLAQGHTCGAPLCAVIRNTDPRPGDYTPYRDIPRPGHADYTGHIKYQGWEDASGGGHFSGRLTAPLCAIGGIALQMLESRSIYLGAHAKSIAGVQDRSFDPVSLTQKDLRSRVLLPIPVLDPVRGEAMAQAIRDAKSNGDSVGGVIECAAVGVPAGLGDPLFGGMENRLSSALFAIPGVKGVSFGSGFAAADLRGSQHNDPFYWDGNAVQTRTNHHGGILGGITTGMPLLIQVAVKPTPSIALSQESLRLTDREPQTLRIAGRHDPCIVPRAVPCVEAACAIALLDALLSHNPLWERTVP